MKNLKEMLNEALNINESSKLAYNDFEKVDKMMVDNKLNSFIKKHESEITEDGLGSSDVKDIINIMSQIHSYISSYLDDEEPEKISDFLNDVYGYIGDDIDSEDWVDAATDLYKKLFKEASHKDLI